MKTGFFFTVVFIYLNTIEHIKCDVPLEVRTESGPVRGKTVIGFTNKNARAFLGIPYAEPPVGKLRFQPPVPVTPWTEVLDATSTSLPCYQTYTKALRGMDRKLKRTIRRPWSENCLTLNVWTPGAELVDVPAYVMFHEGDFLTGSSDTTRYDLATYVAESEVIAITFNYRLGAFGFLTLGTADVPGNFGLMDQHLVVKWASQNVKHFGGKQQAVLLLGFDSGAASVGHQVILDRNAGLFTSAMFSGGSPTCPSAWQTKEEGIELAKSLSRRLDCENVSGSAELECLQNAHPEDIIDASLAGDGYGSQYFKPNVDGSFIKEPPGEALKNGRVNTVKSLITNPPRAASLLFFTLNEDLLEEDVFGLPLTQFKKALGRGGLARTDLEAQMVQDWYLGGNCSYSSVQVREAAVQAYTDSNTACCCNEFVDLLAEAGMLTFRVVFGFPDPNLPSWVGSHSIVPVHLTIGDTLNPKNNYDMKVKEITLQALSFSNHYARRRAEEVQEVVPAYNVKTRPYVLWEENFSYENNYRVKECKLWNDILPAMREKLPSCA